MNEGLKKYQADQRAKKAAKEKEAKNAEGLTPEQKAALEAKAEAEAAAKKAVEAGAIKCSRCDLVFDKSAAKEVANFGGRLGCPVCGFPIPQK